ncbi:MAG: DUF1800 domain-containing protein, partial [Bacteroidota bacterium]
MRLNQRQVQHLYGRAGFGASYAEVQKQIGKDAKTIFTQILESAKPAKFASIIEKGEALEARMAMRETDDKDEKRQMRRQLKGREFELNQWWITQMAASEGFLREKMTLFWHDHFACRIRNAFLMQEQHNTLREHALGSFRDMLHAVAKDTAMLRFLNNQQNKKDAPNENFALEVMELFTLGRGNYTENDIKEAARAFTGWSSNLKGEFIFRKRQHDYGKKTIFGKTGNFDGEEVLDILLEKKETARYLTEKIFQFLVSDTPDEQLISKLSDTFYASDYNITTLLKEIFTSDWFYEERFIGTKIKSPIELISGFMRTLHIDFESPEGLIYLQKVLGQVLFSPPNVAGWPSGKNWIDSTTLLFRMRMSEIIFLGSELHTQAKESGDVNDVFRKNRQLQKLTAKVNWSKLTKEIPTENTFESLQKWLIQSPQTT